MGHAREMRPYLDRVAIATEGDSNDNHIEALREALDAALDQLNVRWPAQAWQVACSDGVVRHEGTFDSTYDAMDHAYWVDHDGCPGDAGHKFTNTTPTEET